MFVPAIAVYFVQPYAGFKRPLVPDLVGFPGLQVHLHLFLDDEEVLRAHALVGGDGVSVSAQAGEEELRGE